MLSLTVRSTALAGVAANAPLFALRQINSAGAVLVVRRVGIGFITTTAFTAAQELAFGLFVCRSFSASDTGGTTISFATSYQLHRTSDNPPVSVDARYGALAAGTRTPDALPLGLQAAWSGGIGVTLTPMPHNLFRHDADVDRQIMLAANEGLEIQNVVAMGAVGVGDLIVAIEFDERTGVQ